MEINILDDDSDEMKLIKKRGQEIMALIMQNINEKDREDMIRTMNGLWTLVKTYEIVLGVKVQGIAKLKTKEH